MHSNVELCGAILQTIGIMGGFNQRVVNETHGFLEQSLFFVVKMRGVPT